MPLTGIKVLDMSQWFVGSVTAAILAEWGAEVVKIEHPPAGDPCRELISTGVIRVADVNYAWELANHDKKSICLDVATAEGKQITYKLAQQSDVFISNIRSRALRRLGLDYESLSRLNPRLIYTHASAYGEKGPDKDRAGFDETAFWARGGFMSILGEPGTPPPPLRGAIGDFSTSLFLASGILLALFHRERTGKGQEVNISLYGSGVWAQGLDVQAVLSSGWDTRREARKAKPNPMHNTYRTRDRKWLQLAMPQTDRYWPGLCRAIGRDDLIDHPDFNSHQKRWQNSRQLISMLDEALALKTRDEWARRFDEQGLVWAPASTIAEITRDPQAIQNEYIRDMNHPQAGTMKLVVNPVKLSHMPVRTLKAGPQLGQHTEETLLALGYSCERIARLKERKVII